MITKKIKKHWLTIIIIFVTLSSCSTIKEAMDPQRKNSAEEFLIQKKLPLSMPPNFNELPIPTNRNLADKEISGNLMNQKYDFHTTDK